MVSRFPSVPVLFEDGKFKSEQERDEGCERLREGVREGEKERKIYSADAPTTTRVLGGAIKGGESHRGDNQKERKKERSASTLRAVRMRPRPRRWRGCASKRERERVGVRRERKKDPQRP